MKKHTYVSIKDIQRMIEEGEIIVNARGRHTIKGRRGASYSWENAPEDLWTTIKENTNPAWVHAIASQKYDLQRKLAFLRHAYENLWSVAFEAGAVVFDGKPCVKCGSTNTQDRGQRHTTYDGTFVEAWRDCYECGNNEYRGDRF